MTGFTVDLFRIGVRAAKEKIGLRMIKRLFVDRSDVFRATFVLSMALLALAFFLQASMKPLPLLDIGTDVLVAIKAQLRLGSFIESFMALDASVLPFRVALNDLPRH